MIRMEDSDRKIEDLASAISCRPFRRDMLHSMDRALLV